MNKYKNGKIYKIISKNTDILFIITVYNTLIYTYACATESPFQVHDSMIASSDPISPSLV